MQQMVRGDATAAELKVAQCRTALPCRSLTALESAQRLTPTPTPPHSKFGMTTLLRAVVLVSEHSTTSMSRPCDTLYQLPASDDAQREAETYRAPSNTWLKCPC